MSKSKEKLRTGSGKPWVRDKDRLKAISVVLSFMLLTTLIYIAYNEGVRVGREEGATFMAMACAYTLGIYGISAEDMYDPWINRTFGVHYYEDTINYFDNDTMETQGQEEEARV